MDLSRSSGDQPLCKPKLKGWKRHGVFGVRSSVAWPIHYGMTGYLGRRYWTSRWWATTGGVAVLNLYPLGTGDHGKYGRGLTKSFWPGELCAGPEVRAETRAFSFTSHVKYRSCSWHSDRIKKQLKESRASSSIHPDKGNSTLIGRQKVWGFWLLNRFTGRTWMLANPSELGCIHFACSSTCPAHRRQQY